MSADEKESESSTNDEAAEAPPAEAPATSKGRETLKKIIALGISLLFSFLVLEGYVRLTYKAQWHIPKSAVREPGIYSARMKPNHESDIEILDGVKFHVKTNERGFRGPLVTTMANKPLRVLSLGDSFTFGWGIAIEDHAMWKFMEGYRKEHADHDVGHAYVACGSWSPRDYYYAYLEDGRQAKADLVVLGVFTGNDILPPDEPRILDPGKVPYVTKLPEPPRPWIRSFDWVRAQLSGSLVVASFRAKHSKPAAFAPFEKDMDRQKTLWDTTFFYLKALNDEVRKDGARMALVLYPSMLQVSTARALENAGYDSAEPEKVLAEFCKDNGIELITLLDALRANNQQNDMYYAKDRHLTTHGHAIAAGVLKEKLAPLIDKMWDEKTRARAAAPQPEQK
jgi:hypothetical protein